MDYQALIRDTLLLLYAMAKDNDAVKDFLFESVNILLSVKYAIKDLAEVLKEVRNMACQGHLITQKICKN